MVRNIERIENALFLFFGLFLFYTYSNNWLLFIILILIPDVSMIGYLRNKKLGAIIYNLAHNYILAALLFLFGLYLGSYFFTIAGIIILCHTGLDRALGFGLKYDKNFKETHIQKL